MALLSSSFFFGDVTTVRLTSYDCFVGNVSPKLTLGILKPERLGVWLGWEKSWDRSGSEPKQGGRSSKCTGSLLHFNQGVPPLEVDVRGALRGSQEPRRGHWNWPSTSSYACETWAVNDRRSWESRPLSAHHQVESLALSTRVYLIAWRGCLSETFATRVVASV
jgi:hypothetical protein